MCQSVGQASSGPHSPPPSPCSPLVALRPPSPAPASQQGRHAAPSGAWASALVLQAAAAASQAQLSNGGGGGGGVGKPGSCAPDHPTSGPSCSGVPLKQGVHCAISSECFWLAGRLGIPSRGRGLPSDKPLLAASRSILQPWLSAFAQQAPCSPANLPSRSGGRSADERGGALHKRPINQCQCCCDCATGSVRDPQHMPGTSPPAVFMSTQLAWCGGTPETTNTAAAVCATPAGAVWPDPAGDGGPSDSCRWLQLRTRGN